MKLQNERTTSVDTAQDVDLSKVKRLWRAQKLLSGWAVEGEQIGGEELKVLVQRLNRIGYREASDAPRAFILAEGAAGAISAADGSETYLYLE
jgi:hypothetical protein